MPSPSQEMQVAKKVATWACHRPRKRCRSPKKWRPGRGGPPEKARRLSWQGLGASWVPLEASGVSLGSSWATSWRVLGASWDLLGGSWGVLGTSWGPLGGTFGKISKKMTEVPMFWTPLGTQIGSQNPRKSMSKKECYTICRFFRFLQNFH